MGAGAWLDETTAPTGDKFRVTPAPASTVRDRAERMDRWRHRLADTPASLAADVRTGLELDQFTLAFQPRLELWSGEVRAVEALLRWHHDHRGEMNPEVFLGAVARSSVMPQLARWVVHRAVLQAAEWEGERPPNGKVVAVSVNLTAADVLSDGLVEFVAFTLEAAGVRPDRFQVEIDTSAWSTNDPVLAVRLRALLRLGVGVVIDGVGPTHGTAGFYLPCRGLNLGRQWVRAVGGDPAATRAIGDLIHRAHGSGLAVCAVGVETRVQADALFDLGCDLAQGFLFSAPVEGSEFGWHRGPETGQHPTARSEDVEGPTKDRRGSRSPASTAPASTAPASTASGLPARRGRSRPRIGAASSASPRRGG